MKDIILKAMKSIEEIESEFDLSIINTAIYLYNTRTKEDAEELSDKTIDRIYNGEDISFLCFIFIYYHQELVFELLTDKEKGNDYDVFTALKTLAEEFLTGGYDNEDEDVEDTTREFLKNKINLKG